MKVLSFKVVRACKGVFERTRRVHEFSAGGASKASSYLTSEAVSARANTGRNA